MAFRCPSCGGSVVFDAETQSVRCQYCESVFSPELFEVKDTSAQQDIPEAGLKLFSCGGCGAELQGTEESVVGFCPYCGGQSLLETGGTGENRAEYVLPFRISRERCAELYRENAKKVWYLPKDLKNPAHLESFTGIYMPYYEYDVQMGASYIEGTKTVERHARYDVVNTYRIDAKVDGGYCRVPYDASRYLDDEIAARVLPFDMEGKRPFNASYLSGFYADASNVPPETYYRDAERQASKDMVDEVAEQIRAREGITVDKTKSRIDAQTRGHHSALLPMWFLTWRKDDRVAYAVVNGDSGKVVSDLPVDTKAFFLGCLAIAAALFAVLELFFQPTPVLTSVLSLIAAVFMGRSVRGSTRRIFEKETHANDKGWTNGAEQAAPAAKVKKKKKESKTNLPIVALVLLGMAALSMANQYVLPYVELDYARVIGIAAVLLVIFSVWRVARWQRAVPEKRPILAILLVALAAVVNAVIVFVSPVNDAWYYLGDAVCILILILASVLMMRVYNLGTMHPLPKLFDRNEVG